MATQFIENTFIWRNTFHVYPHTLTLYCIDPETGKVAMTVDDRDKLMAFLTTGKCAQPTDPGPTWTAEAVQAGELEIVDGTSTPEWFDAQPEIPLDTPSDEETPIF